MSELRIGSLFSGYGGLDMAVREALGGGRVVWYSDIKPAACELLAHRHPDIPNLGDMTAIDYTAAPPIDVLAASWPCQPHSSAGKRLGEKDPRALWPHVARAIDATRPLAFFGENVARIASNGELRRVVRSLAALGYVGAWRVLRASDVCAPHRRERCFVVALRGDVAADPDAAGLEGPGGLHVQPASALATARDQGTARLTLLPTPTARNGAGIDQRGTRSQGQLDLQTVIALLKTPTANLASNGGSQHPDKRRAGGHGPTLADEVEWLLPTPTARSYGTNQGGGAGRVGPVRESLDTMARHGRLVCWGNYAECIARWGSVSCREAPAPTMPSPKAGGRPVLSPAFVEWMMGLPEGWVCDVPRLTRSQMLSLLGDGVVPQQGAAAFRFLLDNLAERLASGLAA